MLDERSLDWLPVTNPVKPVNQRTFTRVAITADGPEVLTAFPKELVTVG